jgi:hypothetical protein
MVRWMLRRFGLNGMEEMMGRGRFCSRRSGVMMGGWIEGDFVQIDLDRVKLIAYFPAS